jgi:hypothetical protein
MNTIIGRKGGLPLHRRGSVAWLERMRLLPAVGVALTYGCAMTPVVWTKPGADPSAANTELADCRTLSVDLMWRMTWEGMWPPSFYDPKFMPPYYGATRPFWLGASNSLELERALIDFCMHSKGYRLSALPD